MKNLLYLLLSVVVLSSCQSQEEKTKELVTEHVRVSMKNPDSFILDSLIGPDTTHLSDLMSIRHTIMLTNANMLAEDAIEKRNYTFLYSFTEKMNAIVEAKKEYDKVEEFKTKMDSVKGGLNDTIVAYKYVVHCRGTNSFNAMVKDEVVVYVDHKGNIIKEGVDKLIEMMNKL